MKATAKDLRFRVKDLLEAIARGERITITFRGKPYAVLLPYEQAEKSGKMDHGLFGLWKDNQASRDVNAYVRNLRRRRFP